MRIPAFELISLAIVLLIVNGIGLSQANSEKIGPELPTFAQYNSPDSPVFKEPRIEYE